MSKQNSSTYEKVVSLTNKELVFGGVATSIDAMAIGVTFGLSYVSLSYSNIKTT